MIPFERRPRAQPVTVGGECEAAVIGLLAAKPENQERQDQNPSSASLGGVFRESKKAKLRIWFTDDAWRRPVRFYSEVAVGSFTMELNRMELNRMSP